MIQVILLKTKYLTRHWAESISSTTRCRHAIPSVYHALRCKQDTCRGVTYALTPKHFTQYVSTGQYILYNHRAYHTISKVLHTVTENHHMASASRTSRKLPLPTFANFLISRI